MRWRGIWPAVLAGSFGILSAQEFRARLQGTVFDPGGGVIPRASATVRSPVTGFERSQFRRCAAVRQRESGSSG